MPRKPKQDETELQQSPEHAPSLDPVTELESPPDVEPTPPVGPRPPQGIVIRHMHTGDVKVDFITKFKRPRIDPACLKVDGQDPFLALPIEGNLDNVRIRQVAADTASTMLSCDPASGAPSIYRLATDAEVEQYRIEHAPKK